MNPLVGLLPQHAIRHALFDSPSRVFGILDFARTPMLYEMLEPHLACMRSLYEGMAQIRLARYAPYVYEAHPAHPAFQLWADRGIGRSWGLFLHTRMDLDALCLQLRKSLFVAELDGSRMYLRYYDPCVMHDLMASLQEQQKQHMFKNIHAVIAETDDGGLTRYDIRHGWFGTTVAEREVPTPEGST